MKEYVIQYFDENGELQVAYIKGRNREDAERKFKEARRCQ